MSSFAPGSSTVGARNNAPLDEFMWCHGCRMEIIPLRTPHLTCPHCNDSFIEEINGVPEADNVVFSAPATSHHNVDDMYANEEEPRQAGPLPWFGGAVGGFTWTATSQFGSASRNIPPLPNRSRERRDDGMGGAGDGRIFNHDNDDDDAEAQRVNPPIFLGGRGLADLAGGSPPTLGEALRGFGPGGTFGAARSAGSDNGSGGDEAGQAAGGLHPDLAHLRDLFSNLFGDGVGDMFDSFGAALGGRAGDYVFGEQGLNDVISGLMEQTQDQGSSAPPAASEEMIEKLERFSRFETEKLARARNHECPTCMDDFTPSARAEGKGKQTATDDMSEDDDPPEVAPIDEDAQQEQLVLMPCKHVFHTDCLVPWLKKSGTCPVCRWKLNDAEADGAGPSNASSSRTNARTQQHQAPPDAFRAEEAGPINWNNFGDEDDFPLPHFRSMTTAQLRASHAPPQPFGTTASRPRTSARDAQHVRATQPDDTDEEWQTEHEHIDASHSRGGRRAAMERDRRTAQRERERMPGALGDDLDLD